MDSLLAVLDGIQRLAWRCGTRFQWPLWLLGWSLDRQATADARAGGSISGD